MPDMEGLASVARLRGLDPSMPLVVTSSDWQRACPRGFSCSLLKPHTGGHFAG